MKYKYKIGDQVTLINPFPELKFNRGYRQLTIVGFDKGMSWPSYEVIEFGKDEIFYVDEDSIQGLAACH